MLVDIGNLVSIRYAIPIAVVDRRAAKGVITVHFADGTEHFTNLGTTEVEPGCGRSDLFGRGQAGICAALVLAQKRPERITRGYAEHRRDRRGAPCERMAGCRGGDTGFDGIA
jgi:hypothetical protein